MSFSEEYLKTLQLVYDLAEKGEAEKIVLDFSIPKMFGAWSSIFWALPSLDKFRNLSLQQLKYVCQALIKSHIEYSKTTNVALRTETIDWIIGTMKIKASVELENKIEVKYLENWVSSLFSNPETEYNFPN